MVKTQVSLLLLFALLSLTSAFEPGKQYVYTYAARTATSVYTFADQLGVIEFTGNVTIQSVDEYTLIVRLTDNRVIRTGNHQGSAEFTDTIVGEEEIIKDVESLTAPFSISHNKRSVTGIKVGADEPVWVVNYKKSIASQLQMDVTGVRREGPPETEKYPAKEVEGKTITVFEDTITGDCHTTITINPMPLSQVFASEAFGFETFNAVCSGNPVYHIIKSKDFNRCKSLPSWHSTTANTYPCDFSKASCGDFLKRTSMFKFIACGESLSKLTVVHSDSFSYLVAQPFALSPSIKTEKLLNQAITRWALTRIENVAYLNKLPAYTKELNTLAYVFEDFEQVDKNGAPVQPNLSDAYMKRPVPVSIMESNILLALDAIANDMKERPDSEKDRMDRLTVITRNLQSFSLDELKYLYNDVKGKDSLVQTLFIDCLVQAGSNPAVMLVKELIETKELNGQKANFAMSSLGFYVKTPTRELLYELTNLLRSPPVQSSKTLLQSGLMMVSDLLNAACGSPLLAAKRFSVSVLGDFCTSKDEVIVADFLPLVKKELESSTEVFDRIVALAALGSLGVEEVMPVLLPIIRGTPGKFDDTAERVRAILSLQRVVFTAPEKIHPILNSLAANFGERPEVRMAATGILFMSNPPLTVYIKLGDLTWFDPSRQVASFVANLLDSLSKGPATTPLLAEITDKAAVALHNAMFPTISATLSIHDIRTSQLDAGIAVMIHSISMRDSNQKFPAYFNNLYYYQLGPLNREPLSVSVWNYNMDDTYQNLLGKIYGNLNPKYGAEFAEKRGDNKIPALTKLWEALNAVGKPADKTAGVLHINLLDSIHRFFNLEKLEDSIKDMFFDSAKDKSSSKSLSLTKYRMLAEYNLRYANELGTQMRYVFTLPMLVSMDGSAEMDGKKTIKANIRAELSWKVAAEVRVDVPFSKNHIGVGVDVLVYSHTPKESSFIYNKGKLTYSLTPGNQIVDLFAYQVTPYTSSRTLAASVNPTVEKQVTHILSVTDAPFERQIDLGKPFGLNIRLIEQSELGLTDFKSWLDYFSVMDVNLISNLGFVPTDIRNRRYVVRYDPTGTRSRYFNAAIGYQYAAKTAETTWVYESGSNKPRYPTNSEVVSYSPINAEFRPLLVNLFKDIDSGNARLFSATAVSDYTDGTVVNFNSTLGLAMNDRYNKDCADLQVQMSTKKLYEDKKVDFAICYKSDRHWNNPPSFGFSKNLLVLSEVDHIGFGPQCEQKFKFTARLTRDQATATAALESAAGQQCLLDMDAGLKHGSPSCAAARKLDHTYNRYELVAESENMSNDVFQFARGISNSINHALHPFITNHTHGERNIPNRASMTVLRDPASGNSDITLVRPHETVIAAGVRLSDEIGRFSPLTRAYIDAFYPLSASSSFIEKSAEITTAGVSESKCYVGTNVVHTYDGPTYPYTIDGCEHVLLTDCHKKSPLAVLARTGPLAQKIVTVTYGKDTIEIDPKSHIIVNGHKTALKDIYEGAHIEIRAVGERSIKALILPLVDGGVLLDIRSILLTVKVQESHVELSAPSHLRGRACGLCGDFNQDTDAEFKTAYRCAVSSGDLMAASFKLNSYEGCSVDKNNDITRRLKEETDVCLSIDQQFRTYLPEYDLSARYNKCKQNNAHISKSSSYSSESCSAY